MTQPIGGPDGAERLTHRVMVADDNIDGAEMMAVWLRMLGCEVHTEHDGTAALRQIERLQPDAAFLDLTMPGVDGYEICRNIRQAPWGAGMLVVALTGWGHQHARLQVIAAGFDHHLLKPADMEAVAALLRAHTPRAR